MYKFFSLLPALCFSYVITKAQTGFTIYLGDDMFTRYDTAKVYSDSAQEYPSIHIINWNTLRHGPLKKDTALTQNRIGIVLTAKATTDYDATAMAVFGNDKDSAIINYQNKIETITHGRSALISISNLFAKNEDKHWQADPWDEKIETRLQGTIQTATKQSSFYYFLNTKKDRDITDGWLSLDNDTLHLYRSAQEKKIKTGKIKKTSHYFITGIQLMKGETCIAAMDYNYRPQVFYIAKDLKQEDKLLITTYFFLLAAYE